MTIKKQKLLYQLTTLLVLIGIIALAFVAPTVLKESSAGLFNNYLGLFLIFALLFSEIMLARAYRLGSRKPVTMPWLVGVIVLSVMSLALLGAAMFFLVYTAFIIMPIMVVYAGVLFFRVVETK